MEERTETGRQRVRRLLWDRLAEAGVKPPRGMTGAAFQAAQAKMTDVFDHMAAESLVALADAAIEEAGRARGHCPREVVLRGWASGLDPRPVERRPIVQSWLRSVEGPQAEAGGYLPELFNWLAQHGRPPRPYDLREIREAATENRRAAQLIVERMERGTVSEEDRAWLEHHRRVAAEAARLVHDGRAKRAADAAEAAAAARVEAAE